MTKLRTNITDPVYTLGVASRLSGVPIHSIRQYIDKGLLLPYKTETNRNLFSEIDVERLRIIKKYMEQGLNVAGIRSLYAQIPGFIIKPCNRKDCDKCLSSKTSDLPCWMVEKKDDLCSHKECRTCAVYLMADPVVDLKKYFLKNRNN
ncbi:MAG TPA: helix-turn-helix domain-containing protein [Bacteroidales bacterium]|nr:helix-turn-helix domain-containing protein [Bacteroidales bacterium]